MIDKITYLCYNEDIMTNYFKTEKSDSTKKIILFVCIILAIFVGVPIIYNLNKPATTNSPTKNTNTVQITETASPTTTSIDNSHTAPSNATEGETYVVQSVVDGDTIKVYYQGKLTSVRIIGINTPETVDPRKEVECFGQEASTFLKQKLTGKTVTLVADPSQTDRDKYDRLLRYVYLNGEDVGLSIIKNGYGYEYTYNMPYQKQSDYKAAQTEAEKAKRGLWADNACAKTSSVASSSSSSSNTSSRTTACKIKGNISSSGEKIYHMPGQKYYNSTKINTNAGERWFCSEQEAIQAGWRKSKV